MKTILKYIDIKLMVIIGLIIAILCLRSCYGNLDGKIIKVGGKPYQVIEHKVDTMYISTVQTIYKPGKTIYKEIPIYIEIPGHIDSSDVVRDYYSKVVYKDTLKLKDSLGYIALTDTIFRNNILGRVWDSHVNKITIKEVLIVKELPKNQIYLGGVLGLDNQNGFTSIGPSVLMKTKKDKLFSAGVGLGLNKTIYYQGGIYIKLW
jgi:hypothetical protein